MAYKDPLFRQMLKNKGLRYMLLGWIAILGGLAGGLTFITARPEEVSTMGLVSTEMGKGLEPVYERWETTGRNNRIGGGVAILLLAAAAGAGFIFYGKHLINLSESDGDAQTVLPLD